MPEGKFGIRDFTDVNPDKMPKHPLNLPHEDDPFCGNDNNRRAAERRKKFAEEATRGAAEPAPSKAPDDGSAPAPASDATATDTQGQKAAPQAPAAPKSPKAPTMPPAWKGNA